MTVLHMDTEALNGLVYNIRQTGRDIETKYSQLSQDIDHHIGTTWIAPGAIEFKHDFEDCSIEMIKMLNDLEALAIKLQHEISTLADETSTF